MERYDITLHPEGRITVPAAIRRKHDLQSGDSVIWFEQDGYLCFRKARPDEVGAGDGRADADDTPAAEYGQKIEN